MVFNEQQIAAIKSNDPRILVVASPGSGKTRTMIAAIEHFVETTKPEKVVAITFTKKATEEIQSRVFISQDTLTVATIHSWSLQELNRLSLKYRFRVKILSEDRIRKILQPLMAEFKISPRMEDTCYLYMMGTISPDLDLKMRAKYEAIFTRYTEYKRTRYLYDFTDLPLYLNDILEEHDEYININGLFVDEFQDVDPTQLKVFDRVIADKKFFIGDPDQAIYIFRGATKEVFKELEDFKTYKLNLNYRSYQPVLDFATSFKMQVKKDWWINKTTHGRFNEMVGQRGEGTGDCQVYVDRRGKFWNSIMPGKQILPKELLPEQLENNQYQVLCRTNIEVKTLKKLGLENAMTIHQAKGLEFKNVLLVDFQILTEEDKNVAYVGITRAKNKLVVAHFETLINNLKHCDKKKIEFINKEQRLAF